MSKYDIIEMAKQAGMVQDGDVWFSANNYEQSDVHTAELKAFAKLVAAKRTEEIARHCIWLNDEAGYADGYDFANAIRVKFQDE